MNGFSCFRALIGRPLAPLQQHGGGRRRRRLYSRSGATLLALITLLLTLISTQPVAAHPLGNFSVNQYRRLEIDTEQITLSYVLDLAELPTVADAFLLDGDSNGAVDAAEHESYLDAKLAEITPRLRLTVGSTALPLEPIARSLTFVPGQAGLETTRIEAEFAAALPEGNDASQIAYRNDYATDRFGWREIVVTHGADIRLDDAEVLALDRTQALQTYPDDLLASPLDERAAVITYQIAPGAATSESATISSESGPPAIGERLAAIVNGGDLTTTGIVLALLAAAAWGALHAFSPGHGKTVVGAYLVGSRGTPRHALFLGLTVTITHTAGVLALGLVILFASRTIMPEQVYPWLSLASGLLVAVLGLTILRQRLLGLPTFGHHHHDYEHSLDRDRDHDHDHDHLHPHDHDHAHDHDHSRGIVLTHGGHTHSHLPPGAEGERVTWRNLLALGISGGLLPCPSALLALLGAMAVGRAGFGLMVVVAFSLGLAATLTGVGILFLYAGRFLERRVVAGPWSGLLRFAPAAAALAVTASGVMIVARALLEIQRI